MTDNSEALLREAREYDAELRDWSAGGLYSSFLLSGAIFDDRMTGGKHPFPDGMRVTTSPVRHIADGIAVTASGTRYKLLTRPSSPAASDGDAVERVAQHVYEAMRAAAKECGDDSTPKWVAGGNSLMQDEARRAATRILSTQPLPSPVSDGGAVLREAVKPWADHRGEPPAYDNPLSCVFEAGVEYAVQLLAKELGAEDWTYCDGTEEFDGDVAGTMINIIAAAGSTDEHGDYVHPRDLRARALASSPASSTDAGLVARKFIDITSTASRIAKQMGAEFVVDEQRLAAMITRELDRLNQPSPPPTGSEQHD